MDNRKMVKKFIDYMCDWVEDEYKNEGHDGFSESLNEKLAYLVRDKGIEKRIQKQLLKRLNLRSTVQYEYYPVGYGKLYIKLLKDEYIPTIKMPRELPKIETDIEFIPLPKEDQEQKEYKAKIIDGETGKVIKEGIWNTKGEFKEDKNDNI